MFINGRTTHTSKGQRAEGSFLILATRSTKECPLGTKRASGIIDIRACLRYVHMRQLGQFMMGTAKIAGREVSLSGAYGHDGLPIHVDSQKFEQEVWDSLVTLPDELVQAWNEGGGWNSAGAEAQQMLRWATEHKNKLRMAGRLP